MDRCTVVTLFTLLTCYRYALALNVDPVTKEVCPEICEPEKCPNVGPIGLSRCPAEQYIVTYRCGCCKKCDIRPVTTTISPNRRDEVCKEMVCPKKKICVLNIQGLPVCKCPTEDLCTKFANRGAGKKLRVCGSDGVTYPSRCHLKVASCASDGKIRVIRKGQCESSLEGPVNKLASSLERTKSSSKRSSRLSVIRGKADSGRKRQHKNTEGKKPNVRNSKHNNKGRKLNRRGDKRQPSRQNKKRGKTYQRALRARS